MNTDGHAATHAGVALESRFWEILKNILTFKGEIESSLVYYNFRHYCISICFYCQDYVLYIYL